MKGRNFARGLVDVLIALFALARARVSVRLFDPRRAIGADDSGASAKPLDLAVQRVAYFIPRVASRLPWRSDCLVQALAAQWWLQRQGITTKLELGVKREKDVFLSHAWLMCGQTVVTGGNLSGFSPLRSSR